MSEVPSLRLLYRATVDIGARVDLGISPLGARFLVPILGGTFEGEGLRGMVLPGGADRQLWRSDGVKELDALYEMRTDDGVVLTVRNRVRIDDQPPRPRYARSIVQLTAPEGKYGWLNTRVFVGTLQSLKPEREAVLVSVFVVQ